MTTLPAVSARDHPSRATGFVTIQAGVHSFLNQRDLRPRSRTVYGQTLGRLVAAVGSDVALKQLQSAEVQALLDRWYGTAAPATWNLNLAAVRSFAAYARRQGW